MCCYCDARTDAQIMVDISDVAVPEEVLACHHGWAQAARVWQLSAASRDGDDVSQWIDLCQRRARALAHLAVASMPVRAESAYRSSMR
jgi:hypothetical protein